MHGSQLLGIFAQLASAPGVAQYIHGEHVSLLQAGGMSSHGGEGPLPGSSPLPLPLSPLP